MWKLTIEDDEGKRTPLPLARDEYSIGRGEENTVRLTERNISRRHAILRRNGTGWLISDISSYNGSYVNGIRLAGEHLVGQGDVVQVGDYRLEFTDEENAAKGSETANAATLPGGGNAGVKPDRLIVIVGPEPGEEFLIQELSISIGRAPELQVSLPHSSVSRIHAEIHALGGGRYEIIDKASANGVRVNGSLLKRGLLEAGDSIELGEVKLKFVGAGQMYRLGADAVRLQMPQSESTTLRPAPPSNAVFGTTASIDNFLGDAGGRSRFVKNLVMGAGVGLLAVIGLYALRRGKGHDTPPTVDLGATAQASNEAPFDAVKSVLDEAMKLAAAGDLDGAHGKIAPEIVRSPGLRDSPDVADIESKWADSVLARAEQEPDVPTRRNLLNSVAQASTVDPTRRRTAAEKLKEVDYLGTDIRELPQANAAAPSRAQEKGEGAPRVHPVLAADPWSATANANATRNAGSTAPTDTATKASELALQGREGEARARAQLEPRVWGGHATPDEIRLLRAICKHMGDHACSDRASAQLAAQK